MKSLEKFLNRFLGPVANYMSQSLFFSTLSEAFMRITPVTIGAAVIMIIGNFPIQGWLDLMISTGLNVHFDALIGATTGIISLFVTFNFAYTYANKCNYDGLSAGLISLASFFIVIPQMQFGVDFVGASETAAIMPVAAYSQFFTAGTGVFTALIVSALSAIAFVKLNDAGFTIKLPETVPSNVSASLSPSLIAGAIFIFWFIVRVAMSYTPFGSLPFVIGLVTVPLQNLATSPWSMMIFFTLTNMLWFFGVHPNMLYSVLMPIMAHIVPANIAAFNAGTPMPYIMLGIAATAGGNGFGGQGATYGFVAASFTAKSERYKSLRKLALVPSIFNINEPLIFGAPLMLNPTFFLPMVLGPALMGLAGMGVATLTNLITVNPTAQMPWTMPAIIGGFMLGGWRNGLPIIAMIVVNLILWFPFFRIADNQALAEEEALTNQ